MEMRVRDNWEATIADREAVAQPLIHGARGSGGVTFNRPMNPDDRSGGLGHEAFGRVPLDDEEREPKTVSLHQMVEVANLLTSGRNLRFEIGGSADGIFVRVIHKESGTALRELPPEDFLDMVAQIQEIIGVFYDEVA